MEHQIREEGGAVVVAFSGDVDLQTSPQVRKILLDCVGQGKTVMAELSGVQYIDSSGVASLIEALQNAKQKGVAFSLVSVSDAAMRVLQLANLDKVFKIHATVEDGQAAGA